MYQNDADFHEVFVVCEQSRGSFHSEYVDYVLQGGLLFKGA